MADEIDQDLLLGGDGPDRSALERLAEQLGIASRVRFVGRIAAEDRFDWLASADFVAMPSRYESFGMVAAESLAQATPVVAFDIPCLRALVTTDVGICAPAFDEAALAAAIAELATDPVRRAALGAAGPATVAGLHWADLAEQQSSVYRRSLFDAGIDTYDRIDRSDRQRPQRPQRPRHDHRGDQPMSPRIRDGGLAPFRRGKLDEEIRALLEDRPSRPRVLLFGNYGNGNLGDEAILTSVLDLLRPYADVTVVSRQPDRIERDRPGRRGAHVERRWRARPRPLRHDRHRRWRHLRQRHEAAHPAAPGGRAHRPGGGQGDLLRRHRRVHVVAVVGPPGAPAGGGEERRW